MVNKPNNLHYKTKQNSFSSYNLLCAYGELGKFTSVHTHTKTFSNTCEVSWGLLYLIAIYTNHISEDASILATLIYIMFIQNLHSIFTYVIHRRNCTKIDKIKVPNSK